MTYTNLHCLPSCSALNTLLKRQNKLGLHLFSLYWLEIITILMKVVVLSNILR